MVGLSIVLETHSQKHGGFNNKVINKSNMMIINTNTKPSSSSSSPSSINRSSQVFPVLTFLQQCFLCNQTLLPGKDIYMYKGDRAFCSVECRCRQIFMDEEESLKKEIKICSMAALKPRSASSSSSSSSSTSASASRHQHHRKGTRNRATAGGGGGFVY